MKVQIHVFAKTNGTLERAEANELDKTNTQRQMGWLEMT